MAYTNNALRETIKRRVMAGGKGGRPGQWSARKAQLLAQQYEKAGGGYKGEKTGAQKSLTKWTGEDWGTKSGKPSTQGDKATGERYLPRAARERLSPAEYAATTAKKRKDTAAGKQFSRQPEKIAEKTSMPLMPGKKNIGKNLKKLDEEGYPRKQALAIALDVSRRKKSKSKRA
jgi:hypothetical protein